MTIQGFLFFILLALPVGVLIWGTSIWVLLMLWEHYKDTYYKGKVDRLGQDGL